MVKETALGQEQSFSPCESREEVCNRKWMGTKAKDEWMERDGRGKGRNWKGKGSGTGSTLGRKMGKGRQEEPSLHRVNAWKCWQQVF